MDTKVLEACLKLRNDPSLAPFADHLRKEREDMRTRLETLSSPHVSVAQGQAQCLTALLNLIDGAPQSLERLNRQRT